MQAKVSNTKKGASTGAFFFEYSLACAFSVRFMKKPGRHNRFGSLGLTAALIDIGHTSN
jgi:hypothetical protein